jgi:hypothetical protein
MGMMPTMTYCDIHRYVIFPMIIGNLDIYEIINGVGYGSPTVTFRTFLEKTKTKGQPTHKVKHSKQY